MLCGGGDRAGHHSGPRQGARHLLQVKRHLPETEREDPE